MRGLKQECVASNNVLPETCDTPIPTVIDKIRLFMGKRKQRRVGKKIESGKLPRGRTDDVAVIHANTLLQVRHFRDGKELSYREIHNRKVTNAGRDAIIDAFTGAFNLNTFNYHDCGTGAAAENVTDTTLGAPVTEARVAGTQTQPTSDVYKTVAQITFSNSYAITEHGILSQAAKPGGTLLDRSVFAPINVLSGDKIEFTFMLSIEAGG